MILFLLSCNSKRSEPKPMPSEAFEEEQIYLMEQHELEDSVMEVERKKREKEL